MAEVKVLMVGVHDRVDDGLNASSTVTLIKSDKNIIVDTGSYAMKNELISILGKEGINPENVDTVVLTHLHLDHLANAGIFKGSKIYHKAATGQIVVTHQDKPFIGLNVTGRNIAKDVEIIDTDGHFPFHISVVVNTDKGKIVIAGDAISAEKYTDLSKSGPAFDKEKYDESRKKILEIADYIVPGHGDIFKVKK